MIGINDGQIYKTPPDHHFDVIISLTGVCASWM